MIFGKKSVKNSNGSATIEAVVAFTGFLFTIFTILNVVNFCRAQTLISNAVDTTAKELTQYGYFYKMSGLQKFSEGAANNAKVGSEKINDVISSVDDLYKSFSGAIDRTQGRLTDITNSFEDGSIGYDTFDNALKGVKADGSNIESSINLVSANINNIMANPISYLKCLGAIAGNEALDLAKSRLIAAPLAKAFFAKHFGSSVSEADAELKKLGVVDGIEGLNFNMSTIFDSEAPDDVHIVVFYRVQIIQLFKFAEMKASIRKDSVAKVWLGGDDVIVKVETPAVPAELPSGDETTNPDEETTTPDEETTTPEEETTMPSGESTGLWALPKRDESGYFEVRDPAFVEHLGEQFNFHPNANCPWLAGHNGDTAYGCAVLTEAETHGMDPDSWIAERAYESAWRSLKEYEDMYDPTYAADIRSYKPGQVKQLIYVVYVPDNISDEELEKIKETSTLKMDEHKAEGREKLGRDLDVTIMFERGCGNYNYGG